MPNLNQAVPITAEVGENTFSFFSFLTLQQHFVALLNKLPQCKLPHPTKLLAFDEMQIIELLLNFFSTNLF